MALAVARAGKDRA
jgi:hypothetical protein